MYSQAVFTGEVTRVRYPVLFERYRHLPGVVTDGVREFPLVQKPVAISVGVGEEPQTGPPAVQGRVARRGHLSDADCHNFVNI